jgi:hypothetical protein
MGAAMDEKGITETGVVATVSYDMLRDRAVVRFVKEPAGEWMLIDGDLEVCIGPRDPLPQELIVSHSERLIATDDGRARLERYLGAAAADAVLECIGLCHPSGVDVAIPEQEKVALLEQWRTTRNVLIARYESDAELVSHLLARDAEVSAAIPEVLIPSVRNAVRDLAHDLRALITVLLPTPQVGPVYLGPTKPRDLQFELEPSVATELGVRADAIVSVSEDRLHVRFDRVATVGDAPDLWIVTPDSYAAFEPGPRSIEVELRTDRRVTRNEVALVVARLPR